MILGYARVSTDEQDLAGQRLRLEQAGAARIYEDTISGKEFDRPGLKRLLDYARPGDTLAVVRIDRLGRNLRELLDLVEDLKRRKVALHLLDERIDTSTAAGEFYLQVFGALAQFERRLISDRTRDALAAARRRGKRLGRLPADPEKIVAGVRLIRGGMKPPAAARAVGLGRSTLYREFSRLEAERLAEEAAREVREPALEPAEGEPRAEPAESQVEPQEALDL